MAESIGEDRVTGKSITRAQLDEMVNNNVIHFYLYYRAIRDRLVGESKTAHQRLQLAARERCATVLNSSRNAQKSER